MRTSVYFSKLARDPPGCQVFPANLPVQLDKSRAV